MLSDPEPETDEEAYSTGGGRFEAKRGFLPVREDEPGSAEREALLEIAHGAVVTTGGISIQRLLSIAIEALLARALGPAVYGVYALGWRITRMCLRFADLGATMTVLRDVPAYADRPDRQRRSLGLSYASTGIGAVVIAAVMALGADWINRVTVDHAAFPPTLRLMAAALVVSAFVRMHAATLKATKCANGEVLVKRILFPAARLVAAVGAVALGYSVVGVVGLLVGALAALAVLAYPATVATAQLRPRFRGIRGDARAFFDHAIPSALSRVGGLLRTRVDVILIGIFLGATAAGVYNVVLVLVGLGVIPLYAFNQLMPPVASDLYAEGRIATLDRVYTTITRLIVTMTVPIVAILAVFGQELLTIFGTEYRQGYALLLVFLAGRFVGNAVGATGILLSMTNNQYPKLVLEWFLAGLNVALTYLFVVWFGLIGAALGTSVAIAIQNSLQLVILHYFEGLWPFDRTFLSPIGAGVAMIAVMVGLNAWIGGAHATVPIALVGLATFGASLRLLGIAPADRFVLRELTATYRVAAGRAWRTVWRATLTLGGSSR